jgi:hypothetical protein
MTHRHGTRESGSGVHRGGTQRTPDTSTFDGGCFCGAVRFRLTAPLTQTCYCHCESCRRSSGAPFVAWCTVGTDRFALAHGRLALHESSPGVRRGFCAQCGTSLTYAHEERPGEIDVAIAALDDSGPVAPTRHIWVEDKLPWLCIDDGLPQFQRFSGQA